MKPLPLEARMKNRTGTGFCEWCADDGIVVAQTRKVQASAWAMQRGFEPPADAVIEEMAPCPYCELGFKIEFQENGAWSPDGFWQGREVAELVPLFPLGKPVPLPIEEGRLRARALADQIVGHFAEPS